MKLNCDHCSRQPILLDEKSSPPDFLATSDGHFLDKTQVKRTLCCHCGVIQISYQPENRLVQFYEKQYDLAESVQNNLIVVNGHRHEKLSHIIEHFFSKLPQQPATGNFLEVACGKGQFIETFQKHFPNWHCIGVDPAAPHSPLHSPLHFSGKVEYRQEFYDFDSFTEDSFAVVAAHGLLNRTAPIPFLRQAARILKQGGILSLELLFLEHSSFTPLIWDHTFTFSKPVFECFLKDCGFEILATTDCVSTFHYLCRRSDKGINPSFKGIHSIRVFETQRLFQQQKQHWNSIVRRFRDFQTECHGKPLTLFGAGLYSAALLSQVGIDAVDFVIDETKNGKFLGKLPTLSLKEAKEKIQTPIFLCAREASTNFISQRLKENGFRVEGELRPSWDLE